MAKEFFKDLPNTTTPLTASRLNGLLDGEEAMGNIVVDSIRSKNIFDYTKSVNGYISNNDTSETLRTGNDTITSGWMEVEPNTTYIISGSKNRTIWQLKNNSGTITGTLNTTSITTNNDTKFVRVYYYASSGAISPTSITDIQVEKGSTATTYVPYNAYGINSFKNEEIVVESIKTKNMYIPMINNQWVSTNGSIVVATSSNVEVFNCNGGDTYTLSATFSSSSSDNIIVMAFYNSSNTLLNRYVATNSTSLSLTNTAPSGTAYMRVGHYLAIPTTIQLEKGDTATAYSPYQELNNRDRYSYGEIIVGTWVDGKPLYRKVLQKYTTSTAFQMATFGIDVSNPDIVMIDSSHSYIIDTTNGNIIYMVNAVRPASGSTISSGGNNWFRVNAERNIAYVVENALTSKPCVLTIEYTKTTD